LRQAWKSIQAELCIPLDLWLGNSLSIPGCLLVKKLNYTCLYLFNWDDAPVQKSISGFLDGECLSDDQNGCILEAIDGLICVQLPPHDSKQLVYSGERSFAVLSRSLRSSGLDSPLVLESHVGGDFKLDGEPSQLSLAPAAQCPLCFDRLSALGMLEGKYAPLIDKSEILGIPFQFSIDSKVIEIRSDDSSRPVSIKIDRKLKAIYILHCCDYAVRGQLNSYLLKSRSGQTEIQVKLGEQIGNSSAKYSLPWHGQAGRIAWHDPDTDACLYLLEWKPPDLKEKVDSLEISWPRQKANLYILGITVV
jgi:hypothetical protein